MVLAYEKDCEGARRVSLNEVRDLPEVLKDSDGRPTVELWRTLYELQTDGQLQLRDMEMRGTDRFVQHSQNPGISITPVGDANGWRDTLK